MQILHISADYPDALAPQKTRAVANLLEITADRFDHEVYSLNRVSPSPVRLMAGLLRSPWAPPMPIEVADAADKLRTVAYSAPPRGLYLRSLLERVADWVANDAERRGLKPRLIHGHKLTIDGIVAARVSQLLAVPYVLTAQGNTDAKVIALRPDLRALYRAIYERAELLFCFAPWTQDLLERRFGRRRKPTVILPVPTPADRIIAPRVVGPQLVSAFNLRFSTLKNANSLFRASSRLEREFPQLRVTLVGGPDVLESAVLRRARSLGAQSVRLAGPVPHAQVQDRFNAACGFVLPSWRESFGMVFVEAVLAGCPILYPSGRAVDGLFEDCPWGIRVDPSDLESVTEGMRKLVRDEQHLKDALAAWQQGPGPRQFQRSSIAAAYADAVRLALAAAPLSDASVSSGVRG